MIKLNDNEYKDLKILLAMIIEAHLLTLKEHLIYDLQSKELLRKSKILAVEINSKLLLKEKLND